MELLQLLPEQVLDQGAHDLAVGTKRRAMKAPKPSVELIDMIDTLVYKMLSRNYF